MKVLAASTAPLSLTELSARCGLAPAKAHRYLASMVDTKMVVHRRSGLYDLGPLAADIGLAALSRFDDVNQYSDTLPALVDRTGLAAVLAVWTNVGATVLRVERHHSMVRHALSPGSTLETLGTTVGAAFVHHLPRRLTRQVLARERQRAAAGADGRDAAPVPGGAAGGDGLFRGPCPPLPGQHTMARAMLDLHGEARCVIALVGDSAEAVSPTGTAARELLAL